VANLKIITNFARTFLGSHYLWGSAGAFPGQLNGARYRTALSLGTQLLCTSATSPSAPPNVMFKVTMSAPAAFKRPVAK
jgi:hypothetical protein